MGYTLKIGNAKPVKPDPSDAPGGSFGWDVESIILPNAPAAPNDANPHANYRWPSYSVWAGFAREVGLSDLFFDKNMDGVLLDSHPGVAPLYPWHREQIDAALVAYKAKHPEAVARFAAPVHGGHPFAVEDEPHAAENGTLARLEWLAWWVGWALDNCENPAFGNS